MSRERCSQQSYEEKLAQMRRAYARCTRQRNKGSGLAIEEAGFVDERRGLKKRRSAASEAQASPLATLMFKEHAIIAVYFTTRSQTNVLSTTGVLSSAASTRNDIPLAPWNVYHRRVALPTAFGI